MVTLYATLHTSQFEVHIAQKHDIQLLKVDLDLVEPDTPLLCECLLGPKRGSVDKLTDAPPTFGTPWYLYMCPAIVRMVTLTLNCTIVRHLGLK